MICKFQGKLDVGKDSTCSCKFVVLNEILSISS